MKTEQTHNNWERTLMIDADVPLYQITSGNELIGDVRGDDNARLVTAAPWLLMALQEAVDHSVVYDTPTALIELFQFVINKATKP